MGSSARVEGAGRLIGKFSAMPSRVDSEVTGTMRRIGVDLQGKSQRAAPVLIGDLRGSAFSRVSKELSGPELEVGFEGLPYIIVQHEGGWQNFMGRYGPKKIEHHPGGGGPPPSKFLEGPWLENKPRYKAAMRDAARKGLRG